MSLRVLLGCVGSPFGGAAGHRRLGDLALRQHKYEHAQVHYTKALALCTSSKYRDGRAWSLRSLGKLALHQEHFARAQIRLREALMLFRESGDHRGMAACQEDLASLAAAQGQAAPAARLLATVEAQRERKGGQRMVLDHEMYERMLGSVRAQLDQATWEAAWAEGRAMSLEQAVAYALEEAPDG